MVLPHGGHRVGNRLSRLRRRTIVRISVRSLVLVAGLGVLAASCGMPGPPGDGEVRSSPVASAGPTPPDKAQTPELGGACGPVPFEWPVRDPGTAFEPFEGDIEALVHDAARVEWDLWSPARWSVVEETPTGLLLFGEEVSATTDGPRYRFARFELVDGEWRAAGWGGCTIQVTADGFGVATFELDPANPPDPADTTLHLLATERACASGKAPGGREALPIVVADSEGVEIIVLVESPAGYQTCPSNPPFLLVVELGAPWGGRTITDGALYPAVAKPWPPPPAPPVLSLFTAGDPPASGTANVVAWDGESAGALLFTADGWATQPRWFQSFEGNYPTTVTGFVTACDSATGCEEECEGAACDALPRLGVECTASYSPTPGEETILTVTFRGTTCTIESTSHPTP